MHHLFFKINVFYSRRRCRQVTEARIKNVTRHMIASGLAAKGYVHINVDEGWLKGRDNTTGIIFEDRVKFPSGEKKKKLKRDHTRGWGALLRVHAKPHQRPLDSVASLQLPFLLTCVPFCFT